MAGKHETALKWTMRAGFGARALIYITVGVLAIYAALTGAAASGTQDALAELRAQPLGVLALWIIGVGMFAYMIWQLVAGVVDVDDRGRSAKALSARAAQIISGLVYGIVGVSIVSLAVRGRSGGDSTQSWTATVLQAPGGQMLVALGGAILVGTGIFYVMKGWRGSYKNHLRSSRFTQGVTPLLTTGLTIYGILLAMVGISFGVAAFYTDPQEAGGIGQALQSLRQVAYGRILLGGAGTGLLAFALYNLVEAKYRVIPRLSGPDVKTLAKRAMK